MRAPLDRDAIIITLRAHEAELRAEGSRISTSSAPWRAGRVVQFDLQPLELALRGLLQRTRPNP